MHRILQFPAVGLYFRFLSVPCIRQLQQLTGTEAGTLSSLLSYGTYVLDFRLNGTLIAGIKKPECRQFKCMELTKT